MEDKSKAEHEAVANASFIVASLDVVAATLCAANGNSLFVAFMVMAGLMGLYGLYFKKKADATEE